jgi:hypothetical protein
MQRTNTENRKQKAKKYSQKRNCVASSNSHIHVSVGHLYIPTIDLPILLQEYVDRSWEYINRSQATQFPAKEYINLICVAVLSSI